MSTQTQQRSLPSTPSPWSSGSQTTLIMLPRPLPSTPDARNASGPSNPRSHTTNNADAVARNISALYSVPMEDPPRTAPAAIQKIPRPRPLPLPALESNRNYLFRSSSTGSSTTHLPFRPQPASVSRSPSKHRPTKSDEAYPSPKRFVVSNPDDQIEKSDASTQNIIHARSNTSKAPLRLNKDLPPLTSVHNVQPRAIESKWYTEKNGKRLTQRDYDQVLVSLRRLRTSKK